MSQSLSQLRKFVSPEIIFGAGCRHNVGNCAKTFGARKVLLVSDPGVIAAGWVADVEASLQAQGIEYVLYSAVSPNPRVEEVMLGADLYRENHCDVIVAVGGGSPMDCGKGIGIVVAHGRSILEFEGVDTIRVPSPPLILIPTTAGTSADVSQFVIISNQQERMKFSIVSKAVVPDVSLIDPETTLSMDPFLSACTGIDALVHAIEAFVSTGHGPLTDPHALEAMRLINGNLVQMIANPNDIALREKIMLGSMQAGLAFSNAILGAVHAMSHSLGGFLDLPHGLVQRGAGGTRGGVQLQLCTGALQGDRRDLWHRLPWPESPADLRASGRTSDRVETRHRLPRNPRIARGQHCGHSVPVATRHARPVHPDQPARVQSA